MIEEVIGKATAGTKEELPGLRQEERTLTVEHRRAREEAKKVLAVLSDQGGGNGRFASERLGELDQRSAQIEKRLAEIRERMTEIRNSIVDPEDARAALSLFDPVWDVLEPRERARIVHLLIERVEFDGVKGEIGLTFHPLGISTLAEEVRDAPEVRLKAEDRRLKATSAASVSVR